MGAFWRSTTMPVSVEVLAHCSSSLADDRNSYWIRLSKRTIYLLAKIKEATHRPSQFLSQKGNDKDFLFTAIIMQTLTRHLYSMHCPWLNVIVRFGCSLKHHLSKFVLRNKFIKITFSVKIEPCDLDITFQVGYQISKRKLIYNTGKNVMN